MSNNFASASLYVGDLHPDVTENILYEKFHTVGQIVSIRVCRDTVSKKSLGYGYVNYQQRNDASRALDTLNFTEILNKPIRIMWQQRDPSARRSGVGNIFIKNLHPNIDSKLLMDTFSKFGNILSCKVITRLRKNKIKNEKGEPITKVEPYGCGFVHYETHEAADSAINNANEKEIEGQKVTVTRFLRKEEREKITGGKTEFTNVFVKNIDETITEEEFVKKMEEFGKIQHSQLMMTNDKKSRGFGFCNYYKHEFAKNAVENLNGFQLKSKVLYAAKAEKKIERKKRLEKMYDKKKQELKVKSKGHNLYIKNLEDSITDENLKENFSKFGEITSAVIMKDKNTKVSKGFGFVCFKKQEDAIKAQSEMNGKKIVSKPIYVAFAQTKEERRMYLERQSRGMLPHGSMPGGIPQVGSYMYPPFPRGPAGFPQMMPQNMNRGRGNWIPQQMFPMNMGMPMFQQKTGISQGKRNIHMGPNSRGGRYKYNQNARNTQPKQPTQPQQQQPIPEKKEIEEIETKKQNETELASMNEDERKNYLGTKLYPLVNKIYDSEDISSKITGMLLEMDNYEILHLIENPQYLSSKVEEAYSVLNDETNEGN